MLNHIRKILSILTIAGLLFVVGGASAYSVPAPKLNSISLLNESERFQKQPYPLLSRFIKDADAAPKYSTIRIATFLWDTESATNAVLRAFKRGVHVRMVIDPTQDNTYIRKLQKALGTDRSKPSFIFKPTGSGLHHSQWANIHAKVITFSKTGKDVNVSYNGSSNLNVGNIKNGSNETHRRANDAIIYRGNWKYVEAIAANKEQHDYYKSKYGHVRSGNYSIVYYPGAPDILYDRLNNFNSPKACKGVRIDGAVFQISDARKPTLRAEALLTAAKNGCDVNFVYNYKPSKILLGVDPAKHLFAVRTSGPWKGRRWIDLKNGLSSKQYIHNKELLIRKTSVVKNKTVVKTWVYGGSSNWLRMNMEQNADFITISTDKKVYDDYFYQWGKLWNHGVAPVFPVYDRSVMGADPNGDPEPEYEDAE